jgi:transketolase
MTAQRDVFIQALYEQALLDKNIVFISADMGAPTLDQWKFNLPEQFIAAGISEQNTINVAAGLSESGKKVFVYMMASWFSRCIEQVRYSCAMANNPITILGNGVALGYAPSGPAHEPNEDIALSRSLLNIEVHSPSNESSTLNLVDLCLNNPKLRYIRLERNYAKQLQNLIYEENEFVKVLYDYKASSDEHVAIFSSGYMLGRALEAAAQLDGSKNISVVDISRVKPLAKNELINILSNSSQVITIEEQSLSGGFGSAICEFICDNQLSCKVLRFGLPENYIFENGSRDYLLDQNGLSIEKIKNLVNQFIQNE